jgi:hypothetical protein
LEQIATKLDRADVGCLLALRAGASFERDALVFDQLFEATCLDILEMREQILSTTIRRDEAKALGLVKPLYRASLRTHCVFPFDDDGRDVHNAPEIKEGYR